MMQFDWYAATLPEKDHSEVIDYLASCQSLGSIETGRPRLGYEGHTIVLDGDGEHWASILHGGANGIGVVGTGEAASGVAQAVRDRWPWHMVSRADVASDMRGDGLFGELVPVCQRIMRSHGVRGSTRLDDDPDKGCTYYMGSRTSQTFGRLYEKGKERFAETKDPKFLEYFDWLRLELETKPVRQNRLACSQYSPDQFWGMSRWARAVSREVMAHDAAKAGVSLYRVSDEQVSRRHMVRQYSKLLSRWKDDAGSWAELGLALKDMIEVLEREKRGHHG